MCTARLFLQGVDLFALKCYLDRIVPLPHQLFLASELKLEELGYLSYLTVKTAFLCVPSFWHNTGV